MAAGDVYKCVLRWTFNNGVTMNNAFHIRLNAAGALFSAQSVVNTYVNNIWPSWRTRVVPQIVLNSVTADRIISFGGDSYTATVNQAGTGVGHAAVAPCVCAGVITWRTATPSKRARGRTYLGGLGIYAGQNAYTWSASEKTNMTAIATAIMNGWNGSPLNGFELGVWSRSNAGASPPYSASAFVQITGYSVQDYIASMGTRRYGRGI